MIEERNGEEKMTAARALELPPTQNCEFYNSRLLTCDVSVPSRRRMIPGRIP